MGVHQNLLLVAMASNLVASLLVAKHPMFTCHEQFCVNLLHFAQQDALLALNETMDATRQSNPLFTIFTPDLCLSNVYTSLHIMIFDK